MAARQRIALLERSVNSLRESERRATTRLGDSRARVAQSTSEHEMVRHALDEARACARESCASGARRRPTRRRRGRAEVEKASCDEELREATDWAARTEAHAEALARALDELSGAGGRAIIGDLEGVLGAFLDLIEIETGWERAVESAAGASVGAMVVDGRRSARSLTRSAATGEGRRADPLPVAESDAIAAARRRQALRAAASTRCAPGERPPHT